jgi:hypothetical protein
MIKHEEELKKACRKNAWMTDYEEYPLYDYNWCFEEKSTWLGLSEFFKHGNWSIRQGVTFNYMGYLFAFVQQVDGGDEWLTLIWNKTEWKSYESCSFESAIEQGRFLTMLISVFGDGISRIT